MPTTELSVPKGHGLVRVAHNLREHALQPQDWGKQAATDFWAFFGDLQAIEATVFGDLDSFGWLTNSFSYLAGSGADFMSSSGIGTTGGLNFDAGGDLLTSPFIFGDYAHALMAGQILGKMPTSLNMECYARLAANNDENGSGFGFIEAGGATTTAADQMAYISSGGTVFELHSGATEDAGATNDTDPHLWKIKCSGTTAEWFMDGTLQGSIALQDDLWPVAWGVGTEGGGDNDPVMSWVHIWYS